MTRVPSACPLLPPAAAPHSVSAERKPRKGFCWSHAPLFCCGWAGGFRGGEGGGGGAGELLVVNDFRKKKKSFPRNRVLGICLFLASHPSAFFLPPPPPPPPKISSNLHFSSAYSNAPYFLKRQLMILK